jgi:hypothetical protein
MRLWHVNACFRDITTPGIVGFKLNAEIRPRLPLHMVVYGRLL